MLSANPFVEGWRTRVSRFDCKRTPTIVDEIAENSLKSSVYSKGGGERAFVDEEIIGGPK